MPDRHWLKSHFKQIAQFGTSGLLGAVIEFSIIRVLVGHYGISPFIAYIPSAGIPAVVVFLFNKHVTFRGRGGQTGSQSKRFIAVYAGTFVLNYSLSSALYGFVSHAFVGDIVAGHEILQVHAAYIAKLIAIAITAVINYTLSHTFIFREVPAEVEVASIF